MVFQKKGSKKKLSVQENNAIPITNSLLDMKCRNARTVRTISDRTAFSCIKP